MGAPLLRIRMTPASGEAIFGRLLAALEAPFAGQAGADSIRAMQESVEEEFSRGGHKTPGGGFETWDETRPWGDRPVPSVPLGGPGGQLAQSWLDNPGQHEPSRVAIYSDHVAEQFHRGGEDADTESFTYELTGKASAFNAWAFGVIVEPGTEITLPARPHATANPDLEEKLMEILSDRFERAFAP